MLGMDGRKIITSSADGYAYADISSARRNPQGGSQQEDLECMRAFKDRFPDSDERLLYGTDRSMIGQEERFPKLFSEAVSTSWFCSESGGI